MAIELTIVIPCLNEEETLGDCIREALLGLQSLDVSSEIVVSDNGSTDRSVDIAEELGTRVVHTRERGYGSALRKGIEEASGRFVIMGDADGSYDFSMPNTFLMPLLSGAELVIGNRFLGGIERGAMPWKNRYIGNPGLSFVGRSLFRTPIKDWHCGIRAVRKESYLQLGVKTTGMEFATEMIAKASRRGMSMKEVEVVLRRDKRSRKPHLRPWRDGWRHLSFMLRYRLATNS